MRLLAPTVLSSLILSLGVTLPASARDWFLDGATIATGTTGKALEVNGEAIVRERLCVGPACTSSEGFFPGTVLKLNGNLPGIEFEDSSSSSFPNRDWRLIINSGSSFSQGGWEYFGINDATDNSLPFSIHGGAPSNAMVVSSGGFVGLGTSLPQANIHITDASIASIRLEQTTGGGNPPGEWDIRANDGGFWLMDLTDPTPATVFQIQQGAPHVALTLDDEGKLGIGRPSTDARLSVWSDNGSATIGAYETTTVSAPRTLLDLTNNGRPEMVMANTATGGEWSIGGGTNLVLKQGAVDSRSAAKTKYLTLFSGSGDLEITGQLITRGPACQTGCDAVFSDDYDLPSIEDHADQMFALGHLPAIGPTAPDRPINVSERHGGMLNELEHAHIYIAKLHRRDQAQSALIGDLQARLEKLEAELSD